jgi:hypothetical protein
MASEVVAGATQRFGRAANAQDPESAGESTNLGGALLGAVEILGIGIGIGRH